MSLPHGADSIAARIAWHEGQLRELRQQQGAELRDTIEGAIGRLVVFSAAELWAHRLVSPVLQRAFAGMQIQNAQQLGKRLRQWRGAGFDRVGQDEHGVLWLVR